ncbi:hypothetical protein T459_11640 [Capsicum annuum]|uniref:Ubiquitin-like protease family profile domain-containing protein n=1 Tax=Capsicum annuum TaxID=4072 RepID=A0A2G2ZMI0_CAPAN|nr:hypothetical protein T459_11640 [Capsicum annuum]
MFKKDHQAVIDDDTYGRGHAVHHGSDLYRETQNDAVYKGEISVSEIQHHHHREIGVSSQSHNTSLFLHLSNSMKGLLNQVIKALKNEENKQSQDVNAANKDAGREDDFKNENCSDLEDLEDVNLTTKEDINEVKLKNQESTDVTDGQDEVGGTVIDSIQAAVDTILFDSQIPPVFPDAQVRELQESKENAPAKQERKKSRVLRSPYISKYGSGSKDYVDFDKEEKPKYAFDGYTINQDLPNELMIDYSHWIAVGLLKTHSAKYTTTSCFFKSYVEKPHTRYYPAEPAVELSTQQDYTESIVVAKNEDFIANIIYGFCMPTGLPWYIVDEVYVPINCGKEFYWVLAVIVLKERLIRVYDSLSSKRKKEPPIEIQKLAVMLPTYLLDNGFYDKTERTDWPSLEAYKEKITQ